MDAAFRRVDLLADFFVAAADKDGIAWSISMVCDASSVGSPSQLISVDVRFYRSAQRGYGPGVNAVLNTNFERKLRSVRRKSHTPYARIANVRRAVFRQILKLTS